MAQAVGQGAGQAHALTQSEWEKLEQDPAFKDLTQKRLSFIVPATIFFIVYYFSLPVLVGYFPDFMSTKVIGNINLAYLFALSQFAMTWILTAVYVKRAKAWDEQAEAIVAKVKSGGAR